MVLKKFLILSIFLHLSLASVFSFQKIYNENKEPIIINVAYVESKNASKEKTEPKKKEKVKKKSTKEIKSKKVKNDNQIKKQQINKKIKKEEVFKEDKKRFDNMLKDLSEKELISKKAKQYDISKKISDLSQEDLNNKIIKPSKNELLSIANILRSQIDSNWIRPPGIKNIENLSFKLLITLNPDGYVTGISIPSSTENLIKKDKSLKPYLDSAIRAIKKTSPFEGLEKRRYNIWKKNTINFIPSEAN